MFSAGPEKNIIKIKKKRENKRKKVQAIFFKKSNKIHCIAN